MLVALDAAAVRRWWSVAADALEHAREEIDALNVFPVADGDTGTNLALTMRAVVSAVADLEAELPATLHAAARAALTGARGNSGVILSAMLRGLADDLHASPRAAGADLARALHRAAETARTAVAEPVEGTVLTVARVAATAACAVAGDDLVAVVRAAARAAAEALARTPDQLPALASAGVVDAGGRGLVVLLDALEAVVTGEPSPAGPLAAPTPVARRESAGSAYAYEVQYLLDAADTAVAGLRTALTRLGDSVVVSGRDGVHNVHVHVNDVGAAIEAGIQVGRPHRITVTRFADQVIAPTGSRVVALAASGELGMVFRRAGAAVVEAPAIGAPSAGDVLEALRSAGADHVVVLPNAGELRGVVEAAATLACDEGRNVVVVPP